MFDRQSWLSLLPFVALCFAVAAIGSWFTTGSVKTWYAGLQRPDWTPPDWIFGPVWTVLYLLMAISAWLVWSAVGWGAALTLFTIQLMLKALWSLMFFGMHRVGAAYAEILLLWMMLIATAVAFLPVSLLAAWLLLPYIAWVAFASYLNFRIWQMN